MGETCKCGSKLNYAFNCNNWLEFFELYDALILLKNADHLFLLFESSLFLMTVLKSNKIHLITQRTNFKQLVVFALKESHFALLSKLQHTRIKTFDNNWRYVSNISGENYKYSIN